MKFEEAYHSLQGVNLPLDKITKIFINEPCLYEEQYHHFLFCPECQQAQLSYKNADTPYLSSYPQAHHDIDCSLAQDTVNPVQAKRMIKDYNSNEELRQEIQRQMNSIMRILLAENNNLIVRENAVQFHNHIHHQNENPNAQQNNHQWLPRKRIDLMLKDADYNVYKIFYGNMVLKWKKQDKSSGYYRISLYTVNTNEFKCQIKITDKVYHYLSEEIKNIDNKPCKIVFIGQLEKGNNIFSNNCGFMTLHNSQLIAVNDGLH